MAKSTGIISAIASDRYTTVAVLLEWHSQASEIKWNHRVAGVITPYFPVCNYWCVYYPACGRFSEYYISGAENSYYRSNFGANFLHDSKWSLQTLIVAAVLLWYHWQILRADQRRGAESLVMRRTVTLLTGDRTGELAYRLEGKLGIKIHTLYQVGQTGEQFPGLPDEEIDRLVNEIQSSPGNKVILVDINGKVMVLPYQDK